MWKADHREYIFTGTELHCVERYQISTVIVHMAVGLPPQVDSTMSTFYSAVKEFRI